MKARLLLSSLLLGLTCLSAPANDTAIWGVGGAIHPMAEHRSIVMEKMDLRVDIYPDIGRAECNYVFHNTGRATTVRMGFPETVGPKRKGERVGFLSFSTAVDGRTVPARIEGGLVEGPWDTTRWRVKTVRFAAGQRRHVRVSYTAELGTRIDKVRAFRYNIDTGASWKGPIGTVRARVFGHYDPTRNWMEADPPFRRTGATSFAWFTRNLEPKGMPSILYHPGEIELTADGQRLYWDFAYTFPPYSYLRHGEAWLQAVMLAEAIGAEVKSQGPEVTLTRGGKVIRLRPGRREMVRNGERLPLSEAPYLKRGHLIVPLRPVATAFDAGVTFDAKRRLTDLSFASSQEPMCRKLSERHAMLPGLLGYAPPELSEYDPAVAAGTPRPWLCVGDLDGSGTPDAAFLLRKGDQLRAAALVESANSWWFLWLPYREQVPMRPDSLRTVLRLRGPGEVADWVPQAAPQTTGRLVLAHDAIEVVAPGRATELYYWDAQRKQFTAGAIAPPPVTEGGGS